MPEKLEQSADYWRKRAAPTVIELAGITTGFKLLRATSTAIVIEHK
jgi:hypothetical protein